MNWDAVNAIATSMATMTALSIPFVIDHLQRRRAVASHIASRNEIERSVIRGSALLKELALVKSNGSSVDVLNRYRLLATEAHIQQLRIRNATASLDPADSGRFRAEAAQCLFDKLAESFEYIAEDRRDLVVASLPRVEAYLTLCAAAPLNDQSVARIDGQHS